MNTKYDQVINPVKQRWALLVGINHYIDPTFPSLRFCINDVLALEKVLTSAGYTIVVLHDDAADEHLLPTRINIEAELARIVKSAGPDDLIWVHFSCHGKLESGKPFLVTQETRAPTLTRTALSLPEIRQQVHQSTARRKVFVLDACHTGVEIGRDLANPDFIHNAHELAEGFAFIAASTAQQVAQEWEDIQHGVFTYYLLEGLSGQADRGRKGFVTVNDLVTHTLDNLRRWNIAHGGLIQEPTYRVEGMGDMILVHYRVPKIDRYLRSIVTIYSNIDTRWNTLDTSIQLPMESVAVEPELSVKPLSLLARYESPGTIKQGNKSKVSLKNALDIHRHLLIIGGIGSGKTTLAQHMCFSMARKLLQSEACESSCESKMFVPILIPCFELELYLYDKSEKSLNTTGESPTSLFIGFLQYYFHKLFKISFSNKFWEDLFRSEDCVIILDGMDEILMINHRRGILKLIDILVSDYPEVRSIVMSRPETQLPSWSRGDRRVLILNKFDRAKQENLLAKLSTRSRLNSSQEQWIEPGVVDEFKDLLQASNFKHWIEKPLFLTAAFFHYASLDYKSIIKKGSSTLERLFALVLNDWDANKISIDILLDKSRLGQSNYKLDKKFELLSYLAWDLYKATNGLETHQRETSIGPLVNRLVKSDNFNKRDAQEFVQQRMEAIYRRSGLLKKVTKTPLSPRSEFSFQYESDVIFLAAYYLSINEDTQKVVLSHLLEHEWRRLVYMLNDLLALKSLASASRFLDSVLENARRQSQQSRIDQQFAEHILIAAQCLLRIDEELPLVKGESNLNDRVKHLVLEILSDPSQSVDLKTRIKLGQVIGLLEPGDPRIGEMVLIPAGSFIMGYDLFPDDRPARTIFLDDFYIDKYPVTNIQFNAFIEDGGYISSEYWTEEGWEWIQETRRTHPKYWNDSQYNLPNYPVVGVSWYEAAAYAKWAGKRLPTEAEWEKAARGAQGREWPWGNAFRKECANTSEEKVEIGSITTKIVDAFQEGQKKPVTTTPIGIYPAGASSFGVFDMSGNVSEWIEDWYDRYPGNDTENSLFGTIAKVRRGGNWGWDRDFARCTCRVASPPTADYAVIGFRCCTTSLTDVK